MFSSSSLYSWNSDKGRNMGPICETDFESRLCFNAGPLNKKKSFEEEMTKNDFIIDYEHYKFLKRKDRQNNKITKSLKNCTSYEDENCEIHEKKSLRSNYGSHLIRSDLSVSCLDQEIQSLQLTSTKGYSRLSVNSNNTRHNGNRRSSNFLNVDYLSLRESNSSIESKNEKLKCNLTADYKISYDDSNKVKNYGTTSISRNSIFGVNNINIDKSKEENDMKNVLTMTEINERRQSKIFLNQI